MRPVISLVGRPNVGKSTLFNALTRSRDALVADLPGLTRDRQYGDGRVGEKGYIVIDTGGLMPEAEGIGALMAEQVRQAIEESDVILFMVDARDGLTPADEAIATELRQWHKPVHLVVNKTDGLEENTAAAEFHALGLGEPIAIAANQGRGIGKLIDTVLPEAPPAVEPEDDTSAIRVAVVGRPNVGKSTLINRLIGEARLLSYDQPGTTRDSVRVPFEKDGREFVLIDTAGIRRKGRVREAIEKFSVVKALQAITDAHVVVAVVDASEGLTEQDLNLIGQVVRRGRALAIAINKWDGLAPEQRERIRDEIERRLVFADFAELHFISALHGTGVGHLWDAVVHAFDSAMRDLPTARLTELLALATERHSPPLARGRRVKPRYAHQGGRNPPVIVVHGNQVDQLPAAYRRYLIRFFREALQLTGTPMQIELKTGPNPYAGKRNKLTPRQRRKRERLIKNRKG